MTARSPPTFGGLRVGPPMRLMLFTVLVVVGALGLAEAHEGFSSSADFYQMVEDVVAGRDYYELLEITPEEAEQPSLLKKNFRTLTRKWHPDKNPSPEAAERFRRVVFAYEILADPPKKAYYDNFRTKGVPWHEVYGRYAHRYGAPEHDIRWVLFWLITTVTVLHYAYRRHRYYLILSRVKANPTYRHRQAQLRAASTTATTTTTDAGMKRKKGKKGNANAAVAVEEDAEPEVRLMGIRPPGWRDLVVVRLVLLPWVIGRGLFFLLRWIFWYKLLGKTPPPPDFREMMRERLGLSKEEFEEWEREAKEKQEKAMKYRSKRYGR